MSKRNRRAQAARSNGAMSHGPTTPEGLATSAQNALKHGLSSSTVVLAHESQEDYDNLEASFLTTYNAVGSFELDLVREMASARWRLRRVETLESAIFNKAIKARMEETTDATEARNLAYADVAESKSFTNIARYSAQLRRTYEKALKELRILQSARAQEQELQNEPSSRETDEFVATYLYPPAEYRDYIAQQLASWTPAEASNEVFDTQLEAA